MTTDPTPTSDLLRSAVGRVGLASATDGELVRRYAADRDDLAFAELVHRFSPAVYALCRRHLADPGTTDDAFQAVFVLLARKAGSLTHPDRVGGWLVATADRVARTARRRHFRRSAKQRPLESVPEPSVEPAPPSPELRAILDDELAKLPPHYRAAVLLCDVDGIPRREAAVRLGIPTGTLSNRLTRARAVLGRRLLRRGVLVTAGTVAGGSVSRASAELLASTVRAALADSPPPGLLSLLTPEMTPMPRGKLILLLIGGLMLAGGATTGVVLLTRPGTPNPSSTSASEPGKAQTVATFGISNEEMAKMPQPKPRLAGDDTGAFAFSTDGRWFVRSPNHAGLDTKLSVMDTTTGAEVASIDQEALGNIVSAVAVTADGKRVFLKAGFTKGGIRVWDVAAKKYEDTQFDLGGLKFDRWRIRLSPDGKTLVAGMFSYDDGVGYFRVWDVASGKVIRTFDSRHTAADGFCFIDGGAGVAALTWTGPREDVTAWVGEYDLETGKEKRRIDVRKAVGGDRGPPATAAVAYTADGKQLVVGGGFRLPEVPADQMDQKKYVVNAYPYSGSVWVIDRETGNLVKTLVDHRFDLVDRLHLKADGKKLIVNPSLPSRLDRTFGGPIGEDAEFVELQQWDVATWELDWVKIVPKAERWKLWNGAAK